jgi:aminopeptidase S
MTAERAPWASSHPDGEPRPAERPPSVVGHAGPSAEPDHVTAAFLQQRAVRLDPASRPAGHPPRRWSAADVTGADVTPHLVALERIADENGGNRASPSPGYEASVEYVTGILRAAGYDVTTPAYPLPKRRHRGGRTSCRNVIAQTRTGDPRWIVMVGAHLDSVRKGPGINDNGSGVAALLEIAARLGGSPVTRSTVRFAFWGSEEDDMAGSEHYVRTLSRRDREDIVLYLNVDMIASPNAGYFVMGGKGKTRAKRGPRGSARAACVLVAELAATGVVAKTLPFDGESDYGPFVDAGVPSVGLLAGDTSRKSPKQARRWGGRSGERFDPHYHTHRDRLDVLDRTALDRFTRAVAGAVVRYAGPIDAPPGWGTVLPATAADAPAAGAAR